MLRSRTVAAVAVAAFLMSTALLARDVLAGPGVRRESVAAAIGTGFTFQGRIASGGIPYSGSCDLLFALFAAETDGTPIGAADTLLDQPVLNGLFSVTVNAGGAFGTGAFTGEVRWLEVSIRCPAGSGSFELLGERQPLTPTPYAIFAMDSASLGGFPAADFARFRRTITVPVVPGDPVASGNRLLSTLAGITGVSQNDPYLVRLDPGNYQLQGTTLVVPEGLTIEGAGGSVTSGTSLAWTNASLAVDFQRGELRSLNVLVTNASVAGVGVRANNGGTLRDCVVLVQATNAAATGAQVPALTFLQVIRGGVAAFAQGGPSSIAVSILGSVIASDAQISAFAGPGSATLVRAIDAQSGASFEVTGGSIYASAGASPAGIFASLASVTVRDTSIEANNDDAITGGPAAAAVFESGTGFLLEGSKIRAYAKTAATGVDSSGVGDIRFSDIRTVGGPSTVGVSLSPGGGLTLTESMVQAGGTPAYGAFVSANAGNSLTIDRSTLWGDTNSVRQVVGTVRIGASKLVGARFGTMTCAASYDSSYAPLGSGC